jgi:serine/threonine-protein kinase
MEFLDGETLGDRLAQGAMPSDEARRLLLQVCEALEAAHREKVVHRDLKPENIWIARPRHGEPYVKVLDFGIAKLLESDTGHGNVTQTGVALGTPLYMSPEQCMGQGVDHRTDIYAMGVLLYQVYAGRLPFDGRSFAEVLAQQLTAIPPPPSQWKSLSPALDAVILRCLEKDPAKRPQTAAELGLALQSALVDISGQTALLSAVSEPEQGQETRQGFGSAMQAPVGASRPRTALVAIVVVGVVLGLGAAILWLRGDNKSVPPAAAVPALALPVAAPPVVPVPVVPPPPVPVPTVAAPPVEKNRRGTARPVPAAEPAPVAKKPGKTRVDDKGLDTDNPFK